MTTTTFARRETVQQKWFVLDAQDQIVGRLASQIAIVLMGKHKPEYTPHVDCGDFVVVLNAGGVRFSGAGLSHPRNPNHTVKMERKVYERYSGYPGGRKLTTAIDTWESRPEKILYEAVRRMLPKNKLARQMLKKLKLYNGVEHPHQAQQPTEFPAYLLPRQLPSCRLVAVRCRHHSRWPVIGVRLRLAGGSLVVTCLYVEASREIRTRQVVAPRFRPREPDCQTLQNREFRSMVNETPENETPEEEAVVQPTEETSAAVPDGTTPADSEAAPAAAEEAVASAATDEVAAAGEVAETAATEEDATADETGGLTLGTGTPADAEQEPAVAPTIRGKLDRFGTAMGTGRRKTSVARVRIRQGDGKLTINGRSLEDYCRVERDRRMIEAPLQATEQHGKVDVWVRVNGGGTTGQAGAIVLGIARALEAMNPGYHQTLSTGGYLTRDGRMVERKKYGFKKARKSFQFSKR